MNESLHLDTSDLIYKGFMERQLKEGRELAASSDLFKLHVPPMAPPHFVAEFHCNGLVREGGGEIRQASEFHVGIWFPPDYLRRAEPFEMLRIFTPNVWHPNVSPDAPLICIGRVVPSTCLVDLIFQIYDVLSYNKFNPRENDCLNRAACSWARDNQDKFPTDRRPLKRRSMALEVKPL